MNRFLLCLSLCIYLTYAASSLQTEDNRYRFDYEYSQEAGGWLKFHQVPADFMTAFQKCKAEGAILASLLHENLLNATLKLQKNDDRDGVLTGIHASFFKGEYSSIDGVPQLKMPVSWAPNEPDNYEINVDCSIMKDNGSLVAVGCNETFPFICFRQKTDKDEITACGTVDKEYTLDTRTGSCYKFHTVARTWRRASMTCAAEGGHLAIINSETEVQVIKEIFAKVPTDAITAEMIDVAAIGIYDWGERGVWYTVHGQTLQEAGYATFETDEPNNSTAYDGGSFCGGVFRNGLLDDIYCNEFNFAFICEKKPDSLLNS